ncbi:MAG: hypothetical protein Tsb004_15420 [Allomuricauda sp.]
MSRNSDMQDKMLQSIEEKTGLAPKMIIADIQSQKLGKHTEIINYVKTNYELSHGFANLLAHLSKDKGRGSSEEDLIEQQYKGKEQLLPMYREMASYFNQLELAALAPKKTYVSVRTKKQFAIIQPSTLTRIDLGLNFPKYAIVPLEPSGSFNSMVSHRIRIENAEDFNDLVKEYIKTAYEMSL